MNALNPLFFHEGMCDPSGVVPWPEDGFDTFIVANDEDNRLRAYTCDGRMPLPQLEGGDLDPFLRTGEFRHTDELGREADIEAGCWLGGRTYWIGSHGRNSKGKIRPERSVFFAADIESGPDGAIVLTPVGTPRSLREALAASPVGLADAIGGTTADKALAPEKLGLNIEGLAPCPDGISLLIGLRNPLRDGRAIVIPFRNPDAVVSGGEAPRLEAPLLVDLAGRGIRSIEYSPARSEYIIVAGPAGDGSQIKGRRFDLYRWTGRAQDAAVRFPGVAAALDEIDDREGGFSPEAVIVDAFGTRALLLSDDGDRELQAGTPCKDLPEAERGFRSVVLDLS